MAILITTSSSIVLNNRAAISRQGFDVEISGDLVVLKSSNSVRWQLDYRTDTLDGWTW